MTSMQPESITPPTQLPVLDVHDLKVCFPTREGLVTALDGLSLQVNPGEIIGLVGESGCGKSTAALAFMRLVPKPGKINAGQVLIQGQNILKLSSSEMRALRGPSVAMIFQDALMALDPRMTVGKQLMEPLQVHLHLTPGAAKKRAIELLTSVDIPVPEKRFKQFPHEFSGGMRQRVMIALALSCNPKLLLADEPTTALDVTVQRQIMSLIKRMRDETGAAIILITHDVGVVAEVCDRVVVMYAGRAVEAGPTQAVFTSPTHPYTIGLLSSTLELTRNRDLPLNAIPGMPPELIHLPAGCVFAPRCSRASETCLEARPVLEMVDIGHQVSCWHWKEG